MKRVVNTKLLMQPIAQFSHAVRIGDFLYIGAMAGTDSQRRLAGNTPGLVDPDAQTGRMFENLDTVMQLSGTTAAQLVRVRSYVADMRFAAQYLRRFEEKFAGNIAHMLVGSAEFPLPQAAVELDALAVLNSRVDRSRLGGVRTKGRFHAVASPLLEADFDPSAPPQQHFRVALRRLVAMLQDAGFGIRDLVNLHVAMADTREIELFDYEFKQLFAPPYPSRTVVGVPLESPMQRVQLEAIAVLGGGDPVGEIDARSGCASPAVLAGDELYIGGQVGLDSGANHLLGAEDQTTRAWEKIERLLAAVGMTTENVTLTNNVLIDWRDYAAFNRGYGTKVGEPYPPRTTRIAALIDPRSRVQVEALAHRDTEGIVIDTKRAG